jgi:7-keto-8-aminopelargonate synthetase-like enzyme
MLQTSEAAATHKLLLFSENDYLGLSSHPAVRTAAAKVVNLGR